MTPFHRIVELFTDKPEIVTNRILDNVRKCMPKDSVPRYEDAFSVLEYLAEKGALSLTEALSVYSVSNPYYKEKNVK